ncbi:hypothetical protein R3P38DRAFT_3178904 [Favolaschia claudopus]|uniref:HMG box domain-containing protein n=1 Tax=Favolaschia claudopus TaxID=2862362 RepID=A0AAW0CQV9_9AGAR
MSQLVQRTPHFVGSRPTPYSVGNVQYFDYPSTAQALYAYPVHNNTFDVNAEWSSAAGVQVPNFAGDNYGYPGFIGYPTSAASSSPSPLATPLSDNSARKTSTKSKKSKPKENKHTVPRPPNCFMIYIGVLAELCGKISKNVEVDSRHISRIAGISWRAMSREEQQPYRDRADALSAKHREEHPDYRFKPTRCRRDPGKPFKPRKVKRNGPEDLERDEHVAKLLGAGKGGEELSDAMGEYDLATRRFMPELVNPCPSFGSASYPVVSSSDVADGPVGPVSFWLQHDRMLQMLPSNYPTPITSPIPRQLPLPLTRPLDFPSEVPTGFESGLPRDSVTETRDLHYAQRT